MMRLGRNSRATMMATAICHILFVGYSLHVTKATSWKLKLLFDGDCPICAREARWLQRRDQHGVLAFEDISKPNFDPAPYGLAREEVMGVIHAVLPDGRIITKLEVFRQAYRHLGLGWVLAPTGWPGLRLLANCGYAVFARYRVPLGRLLGGRSCPGGSCATGD